MAAPFLLRGVAVAVGLAAGTVALCARGGEKREEQKFCRALAVLDSDVTELKTIGPETTVGVVQVLFSRVDTDADEVRKAALKMLSR